MIKNFKDEWLKRLFLKGEASRNIPPDVARRLLIKLIALDRSESIQDLRIPPSNRLEALHGTRSGQYSIRVNDQWRICFKWIDSDAYEVEFVDYHGSKKR